MDNTTEISRPRSSSLLLAARALQYSWTVPPIPFSAYRRRNSFQRSMALSPTDSRKVLPLAILPFYSFQVCQLVEEKNWVCRLCPRDAKKRQSRILRATCLEVGMPSSPLVVFSTRYEFASIFFIRAPCGHFCKATKSKTNTRHPPYFCH